MRCGPIQFRVAKVPLDYFARLQAGASELTLPLPDGGEVTFTLEAYDLLPADLAAKYPQIRTFKGHNPANPIETGRFDLGPQGFHAMFSHQGKMVFVDPLRNAEGYAVYYQQDAYSRLEEDADKVIGADAKTLARKVQVDGNVRKRYVIAISAAGEYTQYPRWLQGADPGGHYHPAQPGQRGLSTGCRGRVPAGQPQ
ncbi:hypothetical protein ACF2JD_03150 [Aeromonas sp. A-5]|uniref:hypothetical protein n=1 Tax=Aeromonas ichthyocola TaxID=3367746 RepID=UPI0038F37707